MDATQYETMMAEIKLINKIVKAEQRIADGEQYLSMAELKSKLGVQVLSD